MTQLKPSLARVLGLGPAWEPILAAAVNESADLQAWRRRVIAETEPLTATALRLVALRMQSMGPSAVAARVRRRKPIPQRQLNRLCLAAALRYTSDDAGPGWRLASWGDTGRRLVLHGVPPHINGVSQEAFNTLWVQGLSLEEISNALGLGDYTARTYISAAPRRWVGKDIAAHFGWSRENHRLKLARGHFPQPDGRDRHSDWWWPATVTSWADTQPLKGCPRCGAQVLRLRQHMKKHSIT